MSLRRGEGNEDRRAVSEEQGHTNHNDSGERGGGVGVGEPSGVDNNESGVGAGTVLSGKTLLDVQEDAGGIVLPREGKAQEPQHDGSDHFYAENFSNFKRWGEQEKTSTPIPPADLDGELEEGCYMYAGIGNMCPESSNCPGCAQIRRLRAKEK